MNSERERAESLIADLHAWWTVTGLQRPTAAEVENMILLVSQRGVSLNAEQWCRVWKLGSRRIAQVAAVMMNHMDAPIDDDPEIAAVLDMLSPAAPSPVKRIRPLANGKPAQPPRA